MLLKSSSPGLQVVVFILIIVIMAIVGEAFFFLALDMAVDTKLLKNIDWSDPRMILPRVLFSQVFTFLISFLLILRYTGDRFTDIVKIGPIKGRFVVFTLLTLILAFLVMPLLTELNGLFRPYLPSGILEQEAAGDTLNQTLFYQNDSVQFIFGLFVMALLPAIFEELVFRGFLINKMLASGVSEVGAMLLSAGIFAMSHMQPLKFIPMFFMGICLAFVYLRFKNIKYSILLHFLFNGIQITIGYLIGTGILEMDI